MQKHKASVRGYADRAQLLSERIHQMRYDKVAEHYALTAKELHRQAAADHARGRTKLATLLEEAAATAEQQERQFARIWALCAPHMHEK